MPGRHHRLRRTSTLRFRLLVVGAVVAVALSATALASGRPAESTAASATRALTGSIVRNNQTWTCNTAVNLDSVAVTIKDTAKNGIVLTSGCTGTIRSISVWTNTVDGIHVNGGAHDLTIAGGSITCTGRASGAHQDGIQAMSGARVTFSHVFIRCPTATNAGMYVNWSGSPNVSQPKAILCNSCYVYGTQSSTAFIGRYSTQSGLLNSTLCPSRYFTFRKPKGSTPIDLNNAYPKTC